MDKKNKTQEQSNTKDGAGRVNKNDNVKEETASHDTSQVDRQEGEMDHGELGGNFNQDNSDNSENST